MLLRAFLNWIETIHMGDKYTNEERAQEMIDNQIKIMGLLHKILSEVSNTNSNLYDVDTINNNIEKIANQLSK